MQIGSHQQVEKKRQFVPTTSELTPLSCEPREGYHVTILICADCKQQWQEGSEAPKECKRKEEE